MHTGHGDVASALEILLAASLEQLRSNRDALLRVYNKLSNASLLPANGHEFTTYIPDNANPFTSRSLSRTLASAEAVIPFPSHCSRASPLPGNVEALSHSTKRRLLSQTASEAGLYTSRPTIILRSLKQDYNRISAFLELREQDAIAGLPTLKNEDYRVSDVCNPNYTSHERDKFRFRKVLGQRALANEFTKWETATHESSRVEEVIRTTKTRRFEGNLRSYVFAREHFVDKAKAEQGLKHGIKLLVIETYLGISGVSALLAFTPSDCWRLKYEDIQEFVQLFKGSDMMELAERKSAWLESCQNLYEQILRERLPVTLTIGPASLSATTAGNLDMSNNQCVKPVQGIEHSLARSGHGESK